MKNVILFIIVAGVSSAVTYLVASPRGQDQKTALRDDDSIPQNANDRIDPTQSRRALEAAKARANRLEAELLAANARLDETPSGEGLPAVSTWQVIRLQRANGETMAEVRLPQSTELKIAAQNQSYDVATGCMVMDDVVIELLDAKGKAIIIKAERMELQSVTK